MYWRGWELLGQDRAIEWDAGRDQTVASNATTWYGPVGLALAVVALVLVARAVARRTLPPVAAVLVAAPPVVLVGSAVAVGFHSGNGRYVMGGVALSAATWGIVRPFRAAAVAIVAVAATTVAPRLRQLRGEARRDPAPRGAGAGVDLDDAAEWAQNLQPELVPVTRTIREQAAPGETIALTRDAVVRPFIYAGWPDARQSTRVRGLASPRQPTPARRGPCSRTTSSARTAGGSSCAPPPWVVYRQVPGASCR